MRIRSTIIALLMAAAASAQTTNNLHIAVQDGNLDNVRHYINRGERINDYDEEGYTPLMYAADLCDPEIISLLMDNGAEPNKKSLYDEEPPALHAAVLKNKPGIVDLFLQYENTNVDFADSWGNTPLYLAVKNGYIECAEVLLKHGAKPDYINRGKRTALQAATYYGDTAMVNLLLQNGANINLSENGRTCFSIAIERGNTLMAEVLRQHNSNIKANHPMHYAAAHSNPETIKYLQNLGIDSNEPGLDKYSPRDLAIMNGRRENARTLSEKGGSANKHILLRYISISEFQEFCKREFRIGAQIGIHEVNTNTALYLGISGRPEYRPALVNAGPHLYYQLREKRKTLYAGIQKRFSLHHSTFPDFGPYISYQFAHGSGKFDGAVNMKPKTENFHVPGAGLYGRFRWVGLEAGYRYYHYQHALEAPEHVCNISLMFYIGFSQKNYKKFGL